MVTDATWPSDWLRGVLELCVLRSVADGPTYGYAIATHLAESGLGTVKGGTLYPLLSRFEAAGLVTVEWRAGEGGPGRKDYRLSDAGHSELRDGAARWASFSVLTATFVDPTGAATRTSTPETARCSDRNDSPPTGTPSSVR